MMYLETEHLLIRKIQISDIPALVELWADSDVTQFMGGPRDKDFLTQSFTEDVEAGQPDLYDLWPVIETASGEVIGHCGLLDKEVDGQSEVELIYVLCKSAWGKGYATEAATTLRDYAFEIRQLERLIALINPANHGSERVAQKAGMVLEKEVLRGEKLMKVYAMQAG